MLEISAGDLGSRRPGGEHVTLLGQVGLPGPGLCRLKAPDFYRVQPEAPTKRQFLKQA